MHRTVPAVAVPLLLAVALAPALADPPPPAPASDPRAVAVAERVLEAMGGREAWDATRFLQWNFFGRRTHAWDRATGDVRIEAGERVTLLNVHTRDGRVFEAGAEVTDPAAKAEALEAGYAQWINDSYWLLMPYKMLDPGVRLEHRGDAALPDGRAADLLGMTFDAGVGLTPQNRYEVWVAKDTGLVEQWAYYADAADAEPRFTLPWAGWKPFGGILLATDHGRDAPWDVAVPDSLPRALFEQP